MGKGGGKSNARGGGGSTKTSYEPKETKITSDDWDDWQMDPEPFQDALNNKEMPRYGAEGRRLTDAEAKHMYDVAYQMQNDGMKTLNKDVTTVYRGESFKTKEAALAKYKQGSTYTTEKLTSVTTQKHVAQEYADMGGGGKIKVVQVITNAGGTRGLKIPNSSEIVSPKGLKYNVTGTSWDRKSSTLKVFLFRNEGGRR